MIIDEISQYRSNRTVNFVYIFIFVITIGYSFFSLASFNMKIIDYYTCIQYYLFIFHF
jgi:hypothetical protein